MAEIQDFLSPKALEQIDGYLKSLVAINDKYVQLAKTYDTIASKTSETIKNEQELEKLNQQRAKTDRELIKNEQLLTKESERLAKQQEKAIKKAEDEASAYKQLENEYKKAAKTAKDMAAQYGVNDERAKATAKTANEYNNKLKSIDASYGVYNRHVGDYGKATEKSNGILSKFNDAFGIAKGVLLGAGAALAGIGITMGTFKNIIAGSTTLTEKFSQITYGLNTAWKTFWGTFRSGDWGNLLENMAKAYERGKEYKETLDQINKTQRAVNYLKAEEKDRVAELDEALRDTSKTNKERLAAAMEWQQIMVNGYNQQKDLNAKSVENELKMLNLKDMSIDQAKQLLEEYLKLDANDVNLRSNAEDLNKLIIKRKAELFEVQSLGNTELAANGQLVMVSAEEVKNRINKIKSLKEEITLLENQTDETGKYAKILRTLEGKKSSGRIESTVEALQKEIDANNAFYYENRRIITTINKLKADSNAENLKNKQKESEEEQSLDEETQAAWEKIKQEEADLAQKQRDDKLAGFLTEKAAFDKNQEEIAASLEKNEMRQINIENENRKKRLAAEKEFADKKKELNQAIYSEAVNLMDGLFSLQQARYSKELSDLDDYYSSRIDAAEANGQDTTALEKEFARKKEEIQEKANQSEKRAKIANILATTAEKALEIQATAAAYSSKVITAPLAVLAYAQLGLLLANSAIQIAAVKAAYAKGTKDSASEFIAGEEGSELMILQDGSMEITPDQATYYKGSKYQHAEIFPHAETQRILAEGQINGLSLKNVEAKLDKLINKDTTPNINIINRYNQRFEKRYEKMRR